MLIKNSLESLFVKTVKVAFIILEALVQDQNFLFVNIYAPNKTSEQILIFDNIKDELDKISI